MLIMVLLMEVEAVRSVGFLSFLDGWHFYFRGICADLLSSLGLYILVFILVSEDGYLCTGRFIPNPWKTYE